MIQRVHDIVRLRKPPVPDVLFVLIDRVPDYEPAPPRDGGSRNSRRVYPASPRDGTASGYLLTGIPRPRSSPTIGRPTSSPSMTFPVTQSGAPPGANATRMRRGQLGRVLITPPVHHGPW